MRYRSNRQYLYPVLRPDADDYGESATLITDCEVHEYDRGSGLLPVTVRFNLEEPTLQQAVRAGSAQCAAMVYCRDTQYRDKLQPSLEDPFTAQGSIPVSRIKNEVQVHPVVLAVRDFHLRTNTAHPEYQGQSVEVSRLAPLATDLHWTFSIDSDLLPVRSIFRLVPDDTERLDDGEFDIDPDPTKPYVAIRATSPTIDAFQSMRDSKDNNWALPTVFASAVLAVLAYVKEPGEDADEENCDWINCVNSQLRKHGIDLESDSLMLSAQRLLQTPFGAMLVDFSDVEDIDAYEENRDAGNPTG